MVEQTKVTGKSSRQVQSSLQGPSSDPIPLSAVNSTEEHRISLCNGELDRILGGGMVEGSLVLK